MDKLDKLYIYSSFSLSSDDHFTLNLLYQPLISSTALGIYLTFSSLAKANGFKKVDLFRYTICDFFHLDETQLFKEITKLEGIGLINTFKDGNDYIYELQSPLSPRAFVEDSMFGVYLLNAIGESMYNYLLQQFKIDRLDKSNLTNITKTFDNVFSTVVNIEQENSYSLLGSDINQGTVVVNTEFDFDLFLSQIDDSTVTLTKNEFKDLILKTAYVYKFDEGDMASLFRQSYNGISKLDPKVLKQKALMLFKMKNDNLNPSIALKKLSSKESELLDVLSKVSPKEILDRYWPNYPSFYINRIDSIYSELDYNKEILNIMIFYILKDKKGELPTLAYFKKVCESWKNQGIVSKEDAYFYILSLKNKPKKTNKKETVKSNKWVDELSNNISERFEKL